MDAGKWRGHIALLSANVIWGINTPISKTIMPGYLPAGALNYFRLVGACLAFWLVSLFCKREKVSKRDLWLLFWAAFFGVMFNQILFLRGLAMTAPIDAAIVATTAPIITMIVSAMYLKEPITWTKVIGVVVGMSGAILLISSSHHGVASESNMWGNLLCLISCFSFAIYLTVFKDLISRYSPVTIMKWLFLYGTIACFPVLYKDVVSVDYASLVPDAWWRIGYVILFATFLSYLLVPIGQKNLRPTTLSMYNYVQPLVASFVAVLIGLDTFGLVKGIAGVLVFSGVYIVTQSKSRAQVLAEKSGTKK